MRHSKAVQDHSVNRVCLQHQFSQCWCAMAGLTSILGFRQVFSALPGCEKFLAKIPVDQYYINGSLL